MRLGLIRPGEYPEPIRAELEQLIACITQAQTVEHTLEGVQRRSYGRWELGADQSLTNNTLTRIAVTVPKAAPTDDLVSEGAGIIRVRRAGLYQVIGQVRFANDVAGARLMELLQNNLRMASTTDTPVGVHRMQCVALCPCAVGDTLAMNGYQSSGGALNAESASNDTYLAIGRVSG